MMDYVITRTVIRSDMALEAQRVGSQIILIDSRTLDEQPIGSINAFIIKANCDTEELLVETSPWGVGATELAICYADLGIKRRTLAICAIEIIEGYRGRGYGLDAIGLLMESLDCFNGLLQASPIEDEDGDGQSITEHIKGRSKLVKHWKQIGFKPIKGTDSMMLASSIKSEVRRHAATVEMARYMESPI